MVPMHGDRVEQDVRELKAMVEKTSRRLTKLEETVIAHIEVCAKSKLEITELIELVRDIKGGMNLANKIRGAILWVGGPLSIALGFWHWLADKLK